MPTSMHAAAGVTAHGVDFARALAPAGRMMPVSQQLVAAVVDAFWICLAAVGTGSAYHFVGFGDSGDPLKYLAMGAVVAALFVPFGLTGGAYRTERRAEFGTIQALAVWIGVFLFLSAVSFAFKMSAELSRGAVLSFVVAGYVGLAARRALWRRLTEHVFAFVPVRRSKVIALGSKRVLETAESRNLLSAAGLIILREFRWEDGKASDRIGDALEYLRGGEAEEVLVFSTWESWPEDASALRALRAAPLPVRLIPDALTAELVSRPIQPFASRVSVEVQRAPLSGTERAFKRAVDVIGAGLGLFLLAPVLAFVAILVRLDSPGSALFRQSRRGFNGKQFRIWKFRTMSVQEDGPNVVQACRNDSRVTRVGKWLRRLSIDELPQLLNVLDGSMSLVGPRPHAVAHDNHYSKLIGDYAYRHHVKPGLTGWAQVNGRRGETRNLDAMAARVEHDLWYINNWTPLLDIRILAGTLVEVLRGQKSAY